MSFAENKMLFSQSTFSIEVTINIIGSSNVFLLIYTIHGALQKKKKSNTELLSVTSYWYIVFLNIIQCIFFS